MPGYTKDKQRIQSRLRRIDGQVRGIEKMVDEDRYSIGVLTQVNATKQGWKALPSTGCRSTFEKDPAHYAHQTAPAEEAGHHGHHS